MEQTGVSRYRPTHKWTINDFNNDAKAIQRGKEWLSTNYAATTFKRCGDKKVLQILPHIIQKNLFEMNHRPKCIANYKISRKKTG